MLVPPCYQIASSCRKVCRYHLIREAGKAIITLFRRVLSQCIYVLEPLHWCLHKGKKCASTPPPPHSRGRQSYHIPIHKAGKAIILKSVLVPPCTILLVETSDKPTIFVERHDLHTLYHDCKRSRYCNIHMIYFD